MAEDRIVVEGEKCGPAATISGQFGMADGVDAAVDPTQAISLMRPVDVSLGEAQFTKLSIGHNSVLRLGQVRQSRV